MAKKKYIQTHVGLVEVVDRKTLLEKAAAKEPVNDMELARMLYPQYNAQLFGGECPPGLHIDEKPISANTFGVMRALIYYQGKPQTARVNPEQVEFKGIFINSKYKFTEEQLKSLLLHEMIHAWLFAQGIIVTQPKGFHGVEFEEKRVEVEAGADVPVPKTESSDAFKLTDDALSKPIYGFFMRYQGRYSVTKFTDKLYNTEMSEIVKWAEKMSQRVQAKEAYVFEITGMAYMHRMTANRLLKSPKMFLIKPEDMKEFKEKATIVRQIK
jgi:hypothetical protein